MAHEILNRSAVVDIAGLRRLLSERHAVTTIPTPRTSGRASELAWAPSSAAREDHHSDGLWHLLRRQPERRLSAIRRRARCRATRSTSDDFPALGYPLMAFSTPENQLFVPKAIDRHRKDLSYKNWDFLVQQQFPADWLLQVGYAGSEGHHLFDRYTVNLIDPVTGNAPSGEFGSFGLKANDGNETSTRCKSSMHRRFSRVAVPVEIYVVAWHHGCFDRLGRVRVFPGYACRACDRSSTNIDVRHNLTVNAIYELPFGQGKQFLTSGVHREDFRRMGASRHRICQDGFAGEHHDVAESGTNCSREHFLSASQSGSRACRSMRPTRASTTGSIPQPSRSGERDLG